VIYKLFYAKSICFRRSLKNLRPMKKILFIFIAAAVCAAFLNLSRSPVKAQRNTVSDSPTEKTLKQKVFDELIAQARQTGKARVIVGLNTDFQPEGNLSKTQAERQQTEIKQSQINFLNRFQSSNIGSVKQFEYIPFLAFETDSDTLLQMREDASISSIQEDEIAGAALAESTAVVGAPTAWTSGFSGSGQTIAVVDSGVDKSHGFLNGKIISEACFSSNVAGTSTSVCPDGVTESNVSGSGVHCPTTVEGCAHGTNVAGIAAGRGTAFSGVAKDANIIAIQIFSRFETTASCGGTAPCGRYWTSDLIKGLERVKTLSNTMNNIAAVNLSMQTGQQFATNCDAQHAATKAAIDNLRSVGIATIVCSGNYSFTNALTAPACISSAVSVGSTDGGSLGTTLNSVSSFSDSSPLLHLLAPGRWINSSIPNNLFQNYSGTSMAAPHVAGAFAVLRQRNPNASVTKMLNTLINTGQPITDSRNGIIKPRIKIDSALAAISSASQFDYDGDGKADISLFRPSNGIWYLLNSQTGFGGLQFGASGDKLVPADYDGDGKTDVAVFRNDTWFIQRTTLGFTNIQFGSAGDIAVPADYDGDGRSDLAVYRPSSGTWFLQRSTLGFTGVQFGIGGDVPMPSDFDGDSKADLALFRPSNGVWYMQQSTNGFTGVQFGAIGDRLVPADYDGDGKTDLAVFRPSTATWFINRSQLGFTSVQFGQSTDTPVPADYDGDGKTDIAVYRNDTWFIQRSTAGFTGIQFGSSNDQPTPNAFVR
jgi:subtilisin